MNTKIEVQARKHGLQLINLFNLDPQTDPVKLCQQLHKLELRATHAHENYCNTGEDCDEKIDNAITTKVMKLLNNPEAFFMNQDPRGYALKLKSEWTHTNAPSLYQDWGGYGIICPEFK
jgi:phytoene dehydrogenase-like protein